MAHVCHSLDRRTILLCERAVLGEGCPTSARGSDLSRERFVLRQSRSSEETNGYYRDDLVCICALFNQRAELYRTAPHPQESGIHGAQRKIVSASVIRYST